jgi:integrase
MSLMKRGDVWWSFIHRDGVRHAQSTGTSNFRQATRIERQFRDELNLRRHQLVEPRPEMTVTELWILFLAEGDCKAWHKDRMKVLLSYWGETPIGRIHKSMVVDYRRRRHAAKTVTDATINRDLEALRHILFWAVEEGLLTANPLKDMHLTPERRKPGSILGLDEEAKLLSAAAPHLRSIIVMSLDTGMRRGEITSEVWEHVDFNRDLLVVTRSKTAGGEGREIPFTARVHDLLRAERKEEGLLFTFKGRPVRIIKTAWKAAIRRAGIRYLRFHDLRHTFNSRLMEAGVIQDVRKVLMGHSTGEDINSRYTHVELPAKREAIRKLEAWVSTQHNQPQQSQGGTHDRTESRSSNRKVISFRVRPKAVEEKDPGRNSA